MSEAEHSPSKIALVADSTCDLPPELLQKYRIEIVPIYVLFGTQAYKDGVEIDGATFYRRLEQAAEHPKTSQPSPQDFAEAYRRAKESQNAEAVLCFTVSAKLSGTYNSAQKAAETAGFPVRVIDSRSASMAMGLVVLAAARARDNGADLAQLTALAETAIHETQIFFTANTLDHLHRSGRVSNAQRMIGSALNIKPILTIQDGIALAAENVRTRKRALARLVELARCVSEKPGTLEIAVMDAVVPVENEQLADEIQRALQPAELIRTGISPALGVHTGPGTIGVAIRHL